MRRYLYYKNVVLKREPDKIFMRDQVSVSSLRIRRVIIPARSLLQNMTQYTSFFTNGNPNLCMLCGGTGVHNVVHLQHWHYNYRVGVVEA